MVQLTHGIITFHIKTLVLYKLFHQSDQNALQYELHLVHYRDALFSKIIFLASAFYFSPIAAMEDFEEKKLFKCLPRIYDVDNCLIV